MKTCAPLFWSTDQGIDYAAPQLSLGDLLPKAGQTSTAYFDHQDQVSVGETLQLIWCPPIADLNSWGEQPSEIAHSHLLQARITGLAPQAKPPHEIHRGLQRYQLQILDSQPLLAALQAQPLDPQAWALPTIGSEQGSFQAWAQARNPRRAEVEGLIYLTASEAQTCMEIILEVDGQHLVGLLLAHLGPAGNCYELGRRPLLGDELQAIGQALKVAQPLRDTQEPYLIA